MADSSARNSYEEFLQSKIRLQKPCGFEVDRATLPAKAFEWQKDVMTWTVRQGRCALFLDTGLGKSVQILAWCEQVIRQTGKPVLLFTPLAVANQFIDEAEKFGVTGIKIVDSEKGIDGPGIYVTNYQKLHKFETVDLGGVAIDESSILKGSDGKYRTALIERFASTPYRLAATATPSPNDHEELGNHAEFLGICSRQEMLATYFVHDSGDTGDWQLKGHAEQAFWEWVASWAMVMRKPSDLGYECDGYDLPPLNIIEHEIHTEANDGRLFTVGDPSLNGQRKARRKTLDARVAMAAKLVNESDGPMIVWCELNDEGDALEKSIKGAIQIAGKDKDDDKVSRVLAFTKGDVERLVSKCSLTGHGMNWQHCNQMVFVGLSNSFEQWYQAVRRCWRYGQTRPVTVHIIVTDVEACVVENVKEKARNHDQMFTTMVNYTSSVNRKALIGSTKLELEYNPQREMELPAWILL